MNTLTRLCFEEGEINEINPDFYKQLKLNYQQLHREFEQLCSIKDRNVNKLKTTREMIKE